MVKKFISIITIVFLGSICLHFINYLSKVIVGNDNTIYFQILFWFMFYIVFSLLYYIIYNILNKVSKIKKYPSYTTKDIFYAAVTIFIPFISCLIAYKLITHKEPKFVGSFIAILIATIISFAYFMFLAYLKKHKKI